MSEKPDLSSLYSHRLAIFASGAGSNAQQIISYFKGSSRVSIALIVSNKKEAGVLDIASKENIPSLIIEKERFYRGDAYLHEFQSFEIDFIVLAGFLWKIPSPLINAFPKKIVNIHPALLPSYGGKGMYGSFVHQAVIAAKEVQSGITIHYVDEHYDHGDVIFQAFCTIEPADDSAALQKKVQVLEHRYYPKVIEDVLKNIDQPK